MTDAETFRAAPSAYVVFGVICGVPGVIGVVAAIVSPMSWAPVLIPVGAYVFACIWLSRYRLAFLNDRLSYESLFASERAISYESIESIAPAPFTGPFESPLTVSVKSKTGQEFRINAKVFPREAVQKLLAVKT